jgi:hypothetical protein
MSPDLAADLRTLHEAGRIASPWLAGMLAGGWRVTERDFSGPALAVLNRRQPDPSDPATVGCLLALLREAAGDQTACVTYSKWMPRGPGWMVISSGAGGPWGRWGATEADALVAAIHALAEECRHAAR